MGTTSSQPQLTVAQEDIRYLGDRMPFGDAELWQVYRAYQAMKAQPAEDRTSFLADLGVLTAAAAARREASPSGEIPTSMASESDERRVWLQVVEHKILPPHFGNRLYNAAFVAPAYRSSSEYPVVETDAPQLRSAAAPETVAEDGDEHARRVKLEAFFDGVAKGGRRGNAKSIGVLFDCCQTCDGASGDKTIQPTELIDLGYRISLASAFLSALEQDDDEAYDDEFEPERFFPAAAGERQGLAGLAGSLLSFCERRRQRMTGMYVPPGEQPQPSPDTYAATLEEVTEWADRVAPMLGAALATFLHLLFFPNKAFPPTRTNFDYPALPKGCDSVFFSSESKASAAASTVLFAFGCMSPSLGGEYYRLYTSASDGLSFNRLQNALLGYGGPTLIIIQTQGDHVFGAFTASPWKESKDFYGNHDCFLYQLQPQTAVYLPSGNGNHFMYCNSFARSRGYDQQAHGIGFGGTVDQPRLFLAESFDNCKADSRDLTFENGKLLGNTTSTNFEIDNLEVWGVGGTEVVQEALGARSRQRDIKSAAIQKARKVDKAQFLDDFKSGLIESKAFAHRGQIRGRESAVIDDEDLNNYKYPQKDG